VKKPPRKRAPRPSPPTVAPAAPPETGALFERIVTILEDARGRVVRAVNSEMVLAYWHIGREIVESVQRGEHRAEYGEAVIRTLSEALTERFGRGFSVSNVKYFRQFYVAFADRNPEIGQSAIGESRRLGAGPAIRPSAVDESADVLVRGARVPARHGFSPALSWGHYRTLAKVEQADARLFYEIEAERAGWSLVDLERQIHTQLFGRLRKSRDQAGLLDLVTRGLTLQRPTDAIRDPYVLDFLDLPDAEQLHESDLEAAIIEKLQHFLLELGKGFAFVGRQKRLEYDDERLYVDLVFYNCILKCYLLIDLKMGKLTHQDVGQMDSYVRLYDDRYTTEGDNPTIGLILCAEKNHAVARYSVLHDSEQLFAARYVTYLPTVEELERELLRERQSIESRRAGEGAMRAEKMERGG
jgi:predicted nuclease of restriction endonuclease-like (RecB) superfamily